jgi:ABC-2 type transport system ATP-binding protein
LLLQPFQRRTVTALDKVNLSIDKGDLFGILGSNGAGKTTLIKILCTLVLPTEGTAYIEGLDVRSEPRRVKTKLGYVIGDERSFYWRLTGRQNLTFFALLNNISHREVKRRVAQLLDLVGLNAHGDKMFKDYSTGMKKMLAIARGMLTRPDILIMDEPTSGLDPVVARKIKNFIKGTLVGIENKTVLLATHNLTEVEELCNRVVVIDSGRVKTAGTIQNIKASLSNRKRFVVGIDNFQSRWLEKIASIKTVQQAVVMAAPTPYSGTRIEVEMTDGECHPNQLMRNILAIGGRISSFQESTPSLEDVFSQLMLRKTA